MAAVTQVRILVTAWTKYFWKLFQPPITKNVRRPGIEPGSTAWKAAMLTIIPPTLTQDQVKYFTIHIDTTTLQLVLPSTADTCTQAPLLTQNANINTGLGI